MSTSLIRLGIDIADAEVYIALSHSVSGYRSIEWDEKERRWTSVTGINVTIGILVIRSSVDHGTAFGKAWKGNANPQSMIEAIRFAARVSPRRPLL